jgi:hypothetical protein
LWRSGSSRTDPHLDRKLFAAEAIEQERVPAGPYVDRTNTSDKVFKTAQTLVRAVPTIPYRGEKQTMS